MRAKWLTNKAIAHRGLHGPQTGAIENSLSAFTAASQNGYGFELDVLLSKDKKAVVFHDLELNRLTHQQGNIIDFNSNDLSQIQFRNSTDKIPTLKDVIQNTPQDVPILIEIKGDQEMFSDISNAVWEEIKENHKNIAIMSFYPEIIEHFKIHYPNVIRGLVATSLDDGHLPNELFDIQNQIDLILKLDVDFIAYDINALPNAVTEFCRDHDKPVLTWTVRNEENRKHAKEHTDNIIFEL